MHYRTFTKMLLPVLFFLTGAGTFTLTAQTSIPFDSKVVTGKLENGLTYYIRTNKKPARRVELRLVVNAGSILEDPDQLGLAHMTEHMAFNGTKNFKKNDIVSYLQEIGVGFGNDLNAYTSFDETVYILPIPTEKKGNLEKGFQILEDWAHQITFNDEDIDEERPIILEESRLGKGASERMFRKILPGLFAGSRYADRLPIGKDSIIRTFPHDAIRRFYRDWYRPNLMAVIVVGDIAVADAEALIRKHFSGLKNPAGQRERFYAEVPPYTNNEVMIVTDAEATGKTVSINYPAFREAPPRTLEEYRTSIVRRLFTRMFNQRLQELTQQAIPPFNGAGSSFGSYARGYNAFSLFANAGTGDIRKAMQALLEETERVKRFGFTTGELERTKKSLLNSYETYYNNRDKIESEDFVDAYVAHFLKGDPIPGIEWEFQQLKELLPQITLDEVNRVVQQTIGAGNENRFTYINAPDPQPGETLPAVAELKNLFADVLTASLQPYQDKAVANSLLQQLPAKGRIVKTKKDPKLGTTTWTLSNGITVEWKATSFKDDEILLAAIRPGGKNLYSLADKYNAEYAVPVVQAMGVGTFSPTDLRKALAGKTVSVNPYMSATTDGIRGNAAKKDLETLFQLMWLYMNEPRIDTALFRSYVQRNKSQFAMASANPQFAFIDTMYQTLYDGNPLAPVALPKPAYFDQINLERAVAIYRERFGNAVGLHVVLVGTLDEAVLRPLVEQYLAGLPVSGKKMKAVDNKVRPISGRKELLVKKGKDEKSLILQFHTGEVTYSPELELQAEAAVEILNIRIIEELREKLGGIYGGGMFGSIEAEPYGNYTFVLQLPSGPEKVDTLIKSVAAEINQMATEGPSQKNLDKVKEQWREQHKIRLEQNEAWLNALVQRFYPGKDIKYFTNYETYVNKLSVQDVQRVAARLLQGPNVFTAVQMPENYVPGEEKKTADRENKIVETIELESPQIRVELFDNGQVDGDTVTAYFNSYPVLSKKGLQAQPHVLELTALPGRKNNLVLFAENLGSTPPNTALLRITNGTRVYNLTVESDKKKNAAIVFQWKEAGAN
ncbi:MAG: M16 family metallopeptidase [Lacibacter sp.]